MSAQPQIAARHGSAPVPGSEVGALLRHGWELLERPEFAAAKALAVGVEATARESADRRAWAGALSLLAACHNRTDAYAAAVETGLTAVRVWQELGDPAGESAARSTIARVLILTGDLADALEEGRSALELADRSGELHPRRLALTAIGIVHLSLRQHGPAMAYCERAAETARLEGAQMAHGNLLDTIGCVFLSQAYEARERGDEALAVSFAESAAERCRQAMRTARRLGNRYYEATALGNLAEGLAFAGRPLEALALMEGFELDPRRDVTSTVTQHLDTHGCICMALGRYAEAAENFRRALAAAAGKNTAMWYCEHLSEAYERAGDLRAALDHHKRFHALFKQVASEAAQRSADIAAIRLETAHAKASATEERARAEQLHHSNVALSQQAEQLLQQSLEDPLTGLANRRSLDRMLAAGLGPRAVALLDVDHFKRVNDTHSHQVGDEVLRRLGGILRGACRSGDAAARYGGEEFALLLDHLGEPEGAAVAERIRILVQNHDWTRIAPGLAVTVSIGVARAAEAGTALEVVALADRRLYEAKRGGRNQVVTR